MKARERQLRGANMLSATGAQTEHLPTLSASFLLKSPGLMPTVLALRDYKLLAMAQPPRAALFDTSWLFEGWMKLCISCDGDTSDSKNQNAISCIDGRLCCCLELLLCAASSHC